MFNENLINIYFKYLYNPKILLRINKKLYNSITYNKLIQNYDIEVYKYNYDYYYEVYKNYLIDYKIENIK